MKVVNTIYDRLLLADPENFCNFKDFEDNCNMIFTINKYTESTIKIRRQIEQNLRWQ
jgi:hypothetical protein